MVRKLDHPLPLSTQLAINWHEKQKRHIYDFKKLIFYSVEWVIFIIVTLLIA